MEIINLTTINSLWSHHHVRWVLLVLNVASGGIIVMWDKRVGELIQEYMELYLVACHFKNVDNGFKWVFAGIYCPNLDNSKRLMWDERKYIHANIKYNCSVV